MTTPTPGDDDGTAGSADERTLGADGLYNARDLGGLPTTDGSVTAFGGYARTAALRYASPEAMRDLRDASFTTVLDLRNDFETRTTPRDAAEVAANAGRIPSWPEVDLPDGVRGVREPLDPVEDLGFWAWLGETGREGTAAYMRPLLERHPERVGAVFAHVADAPGGVLFHCAAGRDRTGLVALLLLALADAEPAAIADDYERSAIELVPFMRLAEHDYDPEWHVARLAALGRTARGDVLDALDGLDARAELRRAGLGDDRIDALRRRLRPEG